MEVVISDKKYSEPDDISYKRLGDLVYKVYRERNKFGFSLDLLMDKDSV